MNLNKSLKIIEYIHAVLHLAMLIPFVYAVAELSDPAGAGVLYLKCLLAAVPVVLTDLAVRRVKSLVWYVLSCAVLLICLAGGIRGFFYLSAGTGQMTLGQTCYFVGIVAETLMIAGMRLYHRVQEAAREREEPLAAKERGMLDSPALSHVWYFVVFYLLGLCTDAKALCDIAFASTIAYTFLALVYEYICAARAYLKINKRTRGISRRRLYGIGLSMLLLFAVFLLAGMMPSVLLIQKRQYTNFRDWFGEVELAPLKYEGMGEFETPMQGGGSMMELLGADEPAPEPSMLMNVAFWIIGGACVLVLCYGVFLIIRQVFRDFRNGRDENGDVVEEIEDKPSQEIEHMNRKQYRGMESEAERIRRRYRKMIRKHRKERPAPYESPAEIEAWAGLKEDEAMQQLHIEYEAVRYGNKKNIDRTACEKAEFRL